MVPVSSTQLSPLVTGEQLSVLPSSFCDPLDPGFASTRLHALPSSARPLLPSSAPDSQHVSPEPDPAAASPPASSVHRHGDPFKDVSSGASTLTLSSVHTPPLPAGPDPSGTELPDWFWEASLSPPPLRPTLHPSLLVSSDVLLFGPTLGLSGSSSLGFEGSEFAAGSNVESFLPAMSGGGATPAAGWDQGCGCSLEASSSSSPVWDPASVAPYSHAPGSSVVAGPVLGSGSSLGPEGPSWDQDLLLHSTITPPLPLASSQTGQGASTHLLLPASAAVSSSWLDPSDPPTRAPPPSSSTPPPPSSSTPPPPLPPSGSGASGSAQEGGDQEWDRIQVWASGGSTFANTHPPPTTSRSTHNPDRLEERSSAFYFESESGSAAEESGLPLAGGAPPEQSGSGGGDVLLDNETSSDFSISEPSDRQEEEEEEPAAGKRATRRQEPPGAPLEPSQQPGMVPSPVRVRAVLAAAD